MHNSGGDAVTAYQAQTIENNSMYQVQILVPGTNYCKDIGLQSARSPQYVSAAPARPEGHCLGQRRRCLVRSSSLVVIAHQESCGGDSTITSAIGRREHTKDPGFYSSNFQLPRILHVGDNIPRFPASLQGTVSNQQISAEYHPDGAPQILHSGKS